MKTSIYNQHQEHSEWMNKLAFYKDEIPVMQKRIEEISSKNTGKDVAIKIEHFQNQLLIKANTISSLVHHIQRDEKVLQADIASNPTAVDHRKAEDHTEERNMVESFETEFNALRKDLNVFLSEWM
jgi:hypothetical protein